MAEIDSPHWPWIALRGLAALIFGMFTLFNPEITLAVLVLLFGAYALADGALTVVWAIAYRSDQRHWVALLIGGLVEIGFGAFTFLMPRIAAIVLLYLVAGWAIVVGVNQIVAGVRLRRVISGEWLLILAGVLSLLFGIVLFLFPGGGVLAVVIWIGAYTVILGILLIALAFRLWSWSRTNDTRAVPRRTEEPTR